MAVLRVVAQMLLAIVLTVALQLVLRGRLAPERRARGWNGASWGAAVYAFGPLSMLGFCWVTRRPGWRGAALALASGLGAAAVLFAALYGVDLAFEAGFGATTWR